MRGQRLTKAPDKRTLIENANTTAQAAQLALEIVNRFASLGFLGRLWWLVSGQIGFRPWIRARARLVALRQRRAAAPRSAPGEGATV